MQAAQEARLLLLDRQARGMRAQIAAMKEGRILSMNTAFSPSDRYDTRACAVRMPAMLSQRLCLLNTPSAQLSHVRGLFV